MQLEEIGLLSVLPKVELAKLIGEVEEVFMEGGDRLELRGAVCLVHTGRLELQTLDADLATLSVRQFESGDVIGDWQLLPDYHEEPRVVALVPSMLYRIPLARWKLIVSKYPAVNQIFQTSVLQQLVITQHNLARYKRHLSTYINELWPDSAQGFSDMVPAETFKAVAAAEAPSRQAPPYPASEPISNPAGKRLAAVVSSLSLAVVLGSGLLDKGPNATKITVILVLAWATLNWLINIIPDYVVALAACLLTVVLGLTSPGETFGGFADPTWFLLLSAFGVGAVVQKSGLLYRCALLMLRVLPPTYTGQSFALAVTGVLLTPCLPSVNSRVAIAGPLAMELSEAMRFSHRSKGSAGLAMSAFLGFGQLRFLFLNGSSNSLLAWGLLPVAIRQSVGWLEWLWVALPLGILVFFIVWWLAIRALFREQGVRISQVVIRRQLAILGPMSGREVTAMWVTLGVLMGFVLQPLHHVDPSWVAMIGFLVMVIIGLLDKQSLMAGIDWQYMLFYGAVTGMVSLIDSSGLGAGLVSQASVMLQPFMGNAETLFLSMAVGTVLVRLLLQPAPAIVLMGLTFFPLSLSLGYNPLVSAVVIVAASTTWIVPQLMSSYTALYAATQGQCFDHTQARSMALVYALIVIAGTAICVPLWQVLGLISMR